MTRPAALHLVIGEEELLVDRAVQRVVDAVRAAEPGAELRRVAGTALTPAGLAELVSPSLFGDARIVVLDAAQDVAREAVAALGDYAAAPSAGVTLIARHAGGARGKAVADAMRAAGAEVTECRPVSRFDDRVAFVRAEVDAAGGTISGQAVSVLIEAVGSDLRELASAAGQLVADTGGRIDDASVRDYYRGRAEVTGFAVAEKAINGDGPGALESLRWALAIGVAPVLVADALADAVRTVARVGAAGRGDPYRLAGALGMPPWKVRKAQGQLPGWRPTGLASAMAAVADVNADVKGAAAHPGYALERAVARIVAAHDRRGG